MATGNRMPDNLQTLTPIIQTPLSDHLVAMLSQQGRKCGFFEAQFYRCAEAYGAKLARKYCDLEWRDYRECLSEEKQKKRINAIRMERRKQYLQGKRDTAFLSDHPQPGEYSPDYFSYNRIH
ncbi:hypothetical protein AB6A40_002688 [Gnathostoma spinigerum]|uniref:Complex I-15 kDa n=1 Tax=Gnathostoma spinigerum TaxID=75299 RepID=A0ABD6EF47_9BILA